jgi:hypothetical protein
MRFCFGVPAWLGALKVSLIVLGLPSAATAVSARLLERHTTYSLAARLGLYYLVFILGCGVWWGILLGIAGRQARAERAAATGLQMKQNGPSES